MASDAIEIIVRVKNDDKSLTTNHLIYDEVVASPTDPTIDGLVRETIKNFKQNSDDIEITDVRVTIKIECT